jgi:hypothetical protein
MEAYMAKKKLKVSLLPIAVQVKKAEKQLKSLRRRVSKSELANVEAGVQNLLDIRAVLLKGCRTRMTVTFLPLQEEE